MENVQQLEKLSHHNQQASLERRRVRERHLEKRHVRAYYWSVVAHLCPAAAGTLPFLPV
uniref:Uncharacterized protein LOC103334913 n=1 Tax=Rhizophora mucronata TaxID=61149 RepID=A0A2P2J3Z2_RHIMU